jgi:hypothetical protein
MDYLMILKGSSQDLRRATMWTRSPTKLSSSWVASHPNGKRPSTPFALHAPAKLPACLRPKEILGRLLRDFPAEILALNNGLR